MQKSHGKQRKSKNLYKWKKNSELKFFAKQDRYLNKNIIPCVSYDIDKISNT